MGQEVNMTAPESNGDYGDRPTVEAGSQLGILYGIIDLGTQKTEWKGEIKMQRKILLQFEFPAFTHVFDEKKGAEPLVLSRKFTWSMGDKANFKAFVQGWRGKAFTKEEANSFDVGKMLKVPAFINIVERTSNGKTYQNIDSASKPPKGYAIPELHNEPKIFSVGYHGFDSDVFKNLYPWVKKVIAESAEYGERYGTNSLIPEHVTEKAAAPKPAGTPPAQQPYPANPVPDVAEALAPLADDDDDDLPF